MRIRGGIYIIFQRKIVSKHFGRRENNAKLIPSRYTQTKTVPISNQVPRYFCEKYVFQTKTIIWYANLSNVDKAKQSKLFLYIHNRKMTIYLMYEII